MLFFYQILLYTIRLNSDAVSLSPAPKTHLDILTQISYFLLHRHGKKAENSIKKMDATNNPLNCRSGHGVSSSSTTHCSRVFVKGLSVTLYPFGVQDGFYPPLLLVIR